MDNQGLHNKKTDMYHEGWILALREIRSDDSDRYFKWINNRSLVIKNSSYNSISETTHKERFENISKRSDIRIFSIILTDENENEELIGSCSLRKIDWIHRSSELQIRIGEVGMQNKGWGTSSIKLLLKFSFSDMNMNRIYLDVFADNKIAQRAYEKCGFSIEGIKRKAGFIDGHFVDVVMMSILKEYFYQVSTDSGC